jgi:RNA polymerase sigma-70 factor (ECF subfamily)
MTESIEEADVTDQVEPRAASVLADEAIVKQVLEGDIASFELIMRRYNQRLFRIARSIVGEEGEAEDVLQDTYISAFQNLGQFAGRARFSTWLTRIAVHSALARRARRNRMQSIDFSDAENMRMVPLNRGTSPEQQASAKELGRVLTRAVDALPEDLRLVFALRMIEGLDTSESANCLQLTEANVKVRLHRARTMLRNQIDRQIGVEARQLYEFGGERCDRIVGAVLARIGVVRDA